MTSMFELMTSLLRELEKSLNDYLFRSATTCLVNMYNLDMVDLQY